MKRLKLAVAHEGFVAALTAEKHLEPGGASGLKDHVLGQYASAGIGPCLGPQRLLIGFANLVDVRPNVSHVDAGRLGELGRDAALRFRHVGMPKRESMRYLARGTGRQRSHGRRVEPAAERYRDGYVGAKPNSDGVVEGFGNLLGSALDRHGGKRVGHRRGPLVQVVDSAGALT